MQLKYYKSLDGVRGLAALMVIFFHFFQHFGSVSGVLGKITKASMIGQSGVDLFFVLSGFLITRILLSSKDKSNFFANFYWKRTLRIFPLYYAFLCFYYFIGPHLGIVDPSSFQNRIYHFTFLQNIAITFHWDWSGPTHYWSLGVEEHFYLFWPLVVYFFNKRILKWIICAIILFALLLRVYFLINDLGVFFFTFTRFDGLAFGALLALYEDKVSEKSSFLFLRLMLLSAISVAILYVFFGNKEVIIQSLKYLLLSTLYFALIGYVLSIKSKNLLDKLLNTGVLQYTGKISYGLYVYHPFIILLISKYMPERYILSDFLVLIVITYIVSGLSFKYFESFFLRFKNKLPLSDSV